MISKKVKDDSSKRQEIEAFFDENMINWSKEIMRQYNRLMAYYRCAIMEVETKFNVLVEEYSLRYDRNPINGIKSRLKHIDSIKEKLETFPVFSTKVYSTPFIP